MIFKISLSSMEKFYWHFIAITLNINSLKDNNIFMRFCLSLQKQGMLLHFKLSVSLSTKLSICQMNAKQVYIFHLFCYCHQYAFNSISSPNINSKYQNYLFLHPAFNFLIVHHRFPLSLLDFPG